MLTEPLNIVQKKKMLKQTAVIPRDELVSELQIKEGLLRVIQRNHILPSSISEDKQ